MLQIFFWSNIFHVDYFDYTVKTYKYGIDPVGEWFWAGTFK